MGERELRFGAALAVLYPLVQRNGTWLVVALYCVLIVTFHLLAAPPVSDRRTGEDNGE